MKNKKNILIILFIIFGMYFVLNFKDHNFKRAVDACIAGSQKLSETKITDFLHFFLACTKTSLGIFTIGKLIRFFKSSYQ